MKIYIAGKITGDPDYRGKFKQGEEALKAAGYVVLNPARLPEGMEPEDYMRICFAMIDVADAVALLPDWSESKGARLEFNYCQYAGKWAVALEEYTRPPKGEGGARKAKEAET